MTRHVLYAIGIFCLCTETSFSQSQWTDIWETETNFYTVQDSFNAHWADRDETVKGNGYKQYKFWENQMAPRVYPTGDLTLPYQAWQNYQDYLALHPRSGDRAPDSVWTAMGPFGDMTGVSEALLPRKAGRISFITFHPTIPTTFWIGTPAGGLWKTTDNGATWDSQNDLLAVTGCNDLAIDPTNPNIMYIATGDGYLFSSNGSMGVLKSVDGGLNWNTCNLDFTPSALVHVRRIIINPVNPLIVMAATSIGLFRTTNGGATAWDTVNNFSTYDLEFKPGNPSIVYSGGLNFKRSTDGGATFSAPIAAGIPTAGSLRMNVAVTPADPNRVYVVSSDNSWNMQGIYGSVNSGVNFTSSTVPPAANYLGGFPCDNPVYGSDGQGFYDLGIAASPINPLEVVLGGINTYRSTNGAAGPWVNLSCAYSVATDPPFMHADQHDYDYTPAGVLYGVNDGGVNYFDGTEWVDISEPMNIAQIYRIGLSSLTPNLWITGHQDNGTNIHFSDDTYEAGLSGDGLDCIIDRTDDEVMFATRGFGKLFKSYNSGEDWTPSDLGMSAAPAGVLMPIKQDPLVADTYYAGRNQMYRSTFDGTLWGATPGIMLGVSGTEYITEFAIAPSNNQIIYAIHGNTGVFKTVTAATTNWSLSNGTVPNVITLWAGSLTDVEVHPTDPQTIWVTQSAYNAGKKVWKTTDGGLNWFNISYDLPNLPANCLAYEPGSSPGRIYVGMDIGVYYLDAGSTSWTLYNEGLPNTKVSDLEISPAYPTMLTASTYGRGVWRIGVAPDPAPPVSSYEATGGLCAIPATFEMLDLSSNLPDEWSWTVTPAAGVVISTPTEQHPNITFSSAGTYTVSLTATNPFGTGSTADQVLVIGPPDVAVSASDTTICLDADVTVTATGADSYSWEPGSLSGAAINLIPGITTTYFVTGTGSNGCTTLDSIQINVVDCAGITPTEEIGFSLSLFPNPADQKLYVLIHVNKATDFDIELHDAEGKIALSQSTQFTPSANQAELDISNLAKGVYSLNLMTQDGNKQTMQFIKY